MELAITLLILYVVVIVLWFFCSAANLCILIPLQSKLTKAKADFSVSLVAVLLAPFFSCVAVVAILCSLWGILVSALKQKES